MGTSLRQARELEPEVQAIRKELFDKYIMPFRNMIYKLCIKYSDNPEDVEENYTIVLTTLYRGIETYDPSRSLQTWIHICTKRQVYDLNKRAAKANKQDRFVHVSTFYDYDDTDNEYCGEVAERFELADTSDFDGPQALTVENYRQHYSDDILRVFDSMKPMYRDALLLQEAGYSLREIADIEYAKGTLISNNIDTIKSRLFLARSYLRSKLNRDGTLRHD